MNAQHMAGLLSFLATRARFFYRLAADFVYPPYCLVCDAYLNEQEEWLCTGCWRHLPMLEYPERRADWFFEQLPVEPYFDRSLALYPFSDSMQILIHHLKYKGYTRLARPLGDELGRLLQDYAHLQVRALIPVPLHPRREHVRGYNQSLLLARAVARSSGVPLRQGLLHRVRDTSPQAKMNRMERSKNLSGAFTVSDASILQDATVALVDDVLTTGHTLQECSRMLKSAGCASVVALTVVRVEK